MIIETFYARGHVYQFEVKYDFWGYAIVNVIEDNVYVGLINNRFSISKAKEVIENDSNYKGLIII
ncbi:TPA: hypothetical protein O6L53_002736 [Staphylococcus aureus]|nr:hypothetical protein [Staphylococcus aureus]HDB3143330.1 hypothetical protein [Staphylococcus aureus]HDE8374463.1 hypothetical protein [Staphylococcus aureus]